MVPGSACRYHPCLFVHVILTISSIFDRFTHQGRGLITSAPYFFDPYLEIMTLYPGCAPLKKYYTT